MLTMKKLKRSPSAASERRTLYVKPEHQEPLEWVQHHTQAHSLSEAVFAALSELKALIRERQVQALEQAHGLWKDDSPIAKLNKRASEFARLAQALQPSVLAVGRLEAEQAAQLNGRLARKNQRIGPGDALIAGTALQWRLDLLTLNVNEFKRVPSLNVIAP